jgi:hypothetical protein
MTPQLACATRASYGLQGGCDNTTAGGSGLIATRPDLWLVERPASCDK